ncbi:MAG: 5-(carboxyamino)imidazole ribonucleotide synthase [Actinobacteria bacterium]|nr:5-(carboxyamino)imidazole ribonucleotide synthase [Actinomycetota bacterium]
MSAPRVGVIGGGQLARMMQPVAINLGIQLRVLCAKPDDSAAQVIPDSVIGSHSDINAVFAFAKDCDVITFDHEHVPSEVLSALIDAGHNVQPNPSALQFAQDKLMMRAALTEAGIACPKWAQISNAQQLEDFALAVGWPLVLKSAKGGYDGKGVWLVETQAQALEVISDIHAHGQEVLAEECVPFVRELAAQVARSPHGQCVAYPVVQSTQTDGICHEVIAPCPELSEDRAVAAQEMALRIAALLDVTGMLAVELFDTGTELLVNELAMRPHNSGHWSMDGAVTSQFENHLRAVLDLPLGSPAQVTPFAVMVNLLGQDLDNLHTAFRHVMARDPGVKVHLYGKAVKKGRKIGHVNVVGDNLGDLTQRAWHAADYLTGVIDE